MRGIGKKKKRENLKHVEVVLIGKVAKPSCLHWRDEEMIRKADLKRE